MKVQFYFIKNMFTVLNILVLLFTNCIVFHMDYCKPTFAHLTLFLLQNISFLRAIDFLVFIILSSLPSPALALGYLF